MDIRMPQMDGCQATRRIHDIDQLSQVPIIALSAHCEGDWASRAIAAGCEECIPKPAEPDKIDQIITRYLSNC
jgi:CheY-like chemotaxis protein